MIGHDTRGSIFAGFMNRRWYLPEARKAALSRVAFISTFTAEKRSTRRTMLLKTADSGIKRLLDAGNNSWKRKATPTGLWLLLNSDRRALHRAVEWQNSATSVRSRYSQLEDRLYGWRLKPEIHHGIKYPRTMRYDWHRNLLSPSHLSPVRPNPGASPVHISA